MTTSEQLVLEALCSWLKDTFLWSALYWGTQLCLQLTCQRVLRKLPPSVIQLPHLAMSILSNKPWFITKRSVNMEDVFFHCSFFLRFRGRAYTPRCCHLPASRLLQSNCMLRHLPVLSCFRPAVLLPVTQWDMRGILNGQEELINDTDWRATLKSFSVTRNNAV